MRELPLGGRRSIHLAGYGYSQRGVYFVTICTSGRESLFDDPRLYAIVEHCWLRYVNPSAHDTVGELVVMPNHVHGLVRINAKTPVGARHSELALAANEDQIRERASAKNQVPRASPLRPAGPPSGSLGAIIATFKSATTKRINRLRHMPGAPVWQRNYYEHIIRDHEDLARVRQYIAGHPGHATEHARLVDAVGHH